MMAVYQLAGNSTVTPSSARTAVSPDPYTFTASIARAAAILGGAEGVPVAIVDDHRRGADAR
jgi:hypothetical protein